MTSSRADEKAVGSANGQRPIEHARVDRSERPGARAVAAAQAGRLSRFPRAEALALQQRIGNRAFGALMRAGSDQAAEGEGRVDEARGVPDPGLVALVSKEIAKLFESGAGGTAGRSAEALEAGGAGLIAVGAVGGWVLYWAWAARDGAGRYQEQARRAAIARYLESIGAITEEEGNDFILHGHLFIPTIPRKAMTRDGRWWLLGVTDLELTASKQGYQVYILRDADGEVLYIGRSGGKDGMKPDSWIDRVREHIDHIDKTDWIGKVDTITVHSELTFAEALALEEDLIREHPESHNKDSGDFSKRVREGDLAGSLHSALKRPRWRFKTEIVPMRPIKKARAVKG